jgi:hypothetical protein
MVRKLLSLAVVLVGSSWTFAFGQGGGPPTQQLIRVDASGQWQMYYQVAICIPETKMRTVQEVVPVVETYNETIDGNVVTKSRTVNKTVTKEVAYYVAKTVWEAKTRNIDPDAVKAFETDGRPIPAARLKERITGDTLVVVSGNDEMIPDYYASLFKPGTVILALKAQPLPEPMPQVPAAPFGPPAPATSPRPQAARSSVLIRTVSAPEAKRDGSNVPVPKHAPAPTFPPAPAPIFVFASRDGADDVKLRQYTEHSFPTTGYKVKRQGTGKQMVPLQMTQTIRHNEITTIGGAHLTFFLGDGSSVPIERVKEKLSRETTVLYSSNGDEVDPFWLQNLKPATLVIVGPQLPGGCGGQMMRGAEMPAMPAVVPAPATPLSPVAPDAPRPAP